MYWIDPLLSIIICGIIVASTWNLLKDSLRLSLDGVPADVDIQKIKDTALKNTGVVGIHHIHVWAISTSQNAITAHLVLSSNVSKAAEQSIKDNFRYDLEHMKIQHVTIETERTEEDCKVKEC